jgi:hypothetical protein
MAAVVAVARSKGMDPAKLPNIEVPSELLGKRRKGMSAGSPFARQRGCRDRTVRLGRVTGPQSYDAASPQELIRRRRRDSLLIEPTTEAIAEACKELA